MRSSSGHGRACAARRRMSFLVPRSILAALASVALISSASAAVGRIEGTASVTADGQASYVIDVQATPGIAGLTPELAISYGSDTARGILGAGFMIAGLSSITPCARTIVQDGVAAPITLTSADAYCIDGRRLRLISGTYGANNAQYRTEIDEAMRVTSYASAGKQPTWFKVERSNGLIYEYGNTTDSRARSSTSSTAVTFVWALSRISDRSGNWISFAYENDPAAQRFRPDYVDYTGTAATGAGDYRIDFVYQGQARLDTIEQSVPSASEPATIDDDRLLAGLELRRQGSTYRQYAFGYQASAGSNSRLVSVQQCAASLSDCLSPTVFTWQSATPGYRSPVASSAPYTARAFPLDINGDGCEDLVWAQGGTWRYMFGSPSGYGSPTDTGVAAINPDRALVLEWNGDGRTDLLVDSSDGYWRVFVGQSGGLSAATPAGPAGVPSNTSANSWTVADIDGDGRDDLVSASTSQRTLYARINSTTGFSAETVYSQDASFAPAAMAFPASVHGSTDHRRVDFDGDGREDLVVQGCRWDQELNKCPLSPAWWVFLSNGGSLENTGRLYQSKDGGVPVLGDFNADRLTDVVYSRTDGFIGLALSRGRTGFSLLTGSSTAGYESSQLRVADYDGDGYDDLLMAYNPSSGVYWWHAFKGTGAGLSATAVPTTVPGLNTLVTDVNGDSLPDLVRAAPSNGPWTMYPRAGVPGDLLASATDGFGVRATWSRAPMSSPTVYTRGSGSSYPLAELGGSRPLVRQLTQSDGTGTDGTYTLTFAYEAARRHMQGRGDVSFGKRTIIDDRLGYGFRTEEVFKQTFPYIGLPTSKVLWRGNGVKLREVTLSWASLSSGTAQQNERRLPYVSSATLKEYALGGAADGTLYRTVTTNGVTVDPVSGLVVDRTTTTTENSSGIASGSSRSERVVQTSVLNDTVNWCLGRPQATEITASHSLAGGAAITRTYAQTWDATRCRVTQIQLQPGDAKLQVTAGFSYDGFGNIAAETITGAGIPARSTTTSWGTRGQFPESVTNALGESTALTWDYTLGVPLTVRDPNTLSTAWTYDTFGRRTSEARPDQTSTVWTRSSCGSGCETRGEYLLTRSEKSAAGSTYWSSTTELDRFERPFRTASDLPGGGDSIAAVDFDERGQVLAVDLPYLQGGLRNGEWRYAYDEIGRLAREELHDAADAVNRAVTYTYDGLRATRTDPLGHPTTQTSSAWGDALQITDAMGRDTNYEYNAFGLLTRVTDPTGTPVTTISYNVRGMPTTQTDVDMGTWTFDVDALGEIVRVRDAKTAAPGWSSLMTYDPLSRMTSRQDVAEGVTGTFVYGTSAASRNIGRLQAVASSDGSYSETYTYDTRGRLSRRRIISDSTYDFDYAYNSIGLLQTLQYPASTSGYRLSVGYQYTNGYLTRILDAAAGTDIWRLTAMDASGRSLDESLGSSIRVISDYDATTGRLLSRTSGVGGGSEIQNLAYAWDADGNLVSRADLNQGGLTEQFFHDSLDRLYLSRRNGTKNLEVFYQDNGNIWSKFEEGLGTLTYSYHASKKHAVTTAGTNTYGYDANGNMEIRNSLPVSWYSYNLPSRISQPNGNSSQFWYGPLRNRWKQAATYAGVAETTIYAGGLLEKVTKSGVTTFRHLIEAPDGTAAVYLRKSGGSPAVATYYITHDHLGSTDKIVNSNSAVAVAESFSAFGRRRGSAWIAAPTTTDLSAIGDISRDGFASQESIDNLGLVHMNGRVYDPVIARFVSADPLVQAPYNPQSLNRYSYVWNSPLRYVDPSGFSAADGDSPPWDLFGDVFGSGFYHVPRFEIGTKGRSYRDPYAHPHGPRTTGVTADVRSGDYRPPGDGSFSGLAVDVPPPTDLLCSDSQGTCWQQVAYDWWPGYAVGTCIYRQWNDEACSLPTWGLAVVGALPVGGRGATVVGAVGRQLESAVARTAIPSAGGVVRVFEQPSEQIYYRVFSESAAGKWLTAVAPRSSAWAQEALSLPPGNVATFIQQVRVPAGTLIERSRALRVPEWGRLRGGAEQFQLLEEIPLRSFGPGVPFP